MSKTFRYSCHLVSTVSYSLASIPSQSRTKVRGNRYPRERRVWLGHQTPAITERSQANVVNGLIVGVVLGVVFVLQLFTVQPLVQATAGFVEVLERRRSHAFIVRLDAVRVVDRKYGVVPNLLDNVNEATDDPNRVDADAKGLAAAA